MTNKKLQEFIDSIGTIDIINDYGEVRTCFPNGYRASIIKQDDSGYSIACFDKDGYICYDLPEKNNCYKCKTDEEAMDVIRRISEIPCSLDDEVNWDE